MAQQVTDPMRVLTSDNVALSDAGKCGIFQFFQAPKKGRSPQGIASFARPLKKGGEVPGVLGFPELVDTLKKGGVC